MAGYAASAQAAMQLIHTSLLLLDDSLKIIEFLCPLRTSIETVTSIGTFDHVIVGAGEAGSILAYRLADTNEKILVLEAGGCPPIESALAGYLTFTPQSRSDYAMNIYNDSYSCQNLIPNSGGITAGKLLGGTGSINHMIYDEANKADYDSWAVAANDSSWAFPDFEAYFKKWKSGPTIMTKQKNSSLTDIMFNAHNDIGIPFKDDPSGNCVFNPNLGVGNTVRQCGNVAYLSNMINRTNVYFRTEAVVNKIIFNGTTASGVQFSYNGATYTVNANKNVIVAAGAIKTPQLLMLSGVGDKETLSQFKIESVVHNSFVGQNLCDNVGAAFAIALNKTTVPPPADPHEWPVTAVVIADIGNSSQAQTQRSDIHIYVPKNSTGFLQLCNNAFKYKNEFCDAWFEQNLKGDIAFSISSLASSKSCGSVSLNTTSILDHPIVKLNFFNDSSDLDNFAQLMLKYVEPLVKSKTYQNLQGSFIDLGICSEHSKFSLDFWKCYVLATSVTRWQYKGTCALGKVVDKDLNLIGAKGIKVVDASIIPSTLSGSCGATVRALAEKAADIIKNEKA